MPYSLCRSLVGGGGAPAGELHCELCTVRYGP